VKLLFDENLSGDLSRLIADLFPESSDVLRLGLGGQSDAVIWEYAKTGGFVLVTKDEDFQRLSIFRGPPPKVVWIHLGNCATADVARLLRFRADQIRAFIDDAEAAFLALG
jgi:predicted nuclease of predicted toxin-antitoxin system